MNVFINDEPRELNQGTTLDGLSRELGLESQKGWAIALNDSIIPKERHHKSILSEGDRVLIIKATQGG